jgi:hypothetical protein
MILDRKIYNFLFSLNLRFNKYIPSFLLSKNLPDFLIIGSAKCATTFLKENLRNHPDIYLPRSEVDYFTTNYDKGIQWYQSHFWTNRKYNGDKSPSYIYDTQCHQKIFDLLPNAKLILLLRHPVERAYSNWNMRNNKNRLGKIDGFDSNNFNQLVLAYLNAQNNQMHHFENPYDIIHMGKYILQIDNLLKIFPRENLLIAAIENISIDDLHMELFFKELLRFLNIEPSKNHANYQKIREGQYHDKQIDNETKNILLELYRPYNEQLFEFLGYEIESWKD